MTFPHHLDAPGQQLYHVREHTVRWGLTLRYLQSISDFFKSPKWGINLLLGGVCVLIPVVGPIVYAGYCIGVFAQQTRQRNLMYADFEFDRFADYLLRGLWPFLVSLVVGLITLPIIFVMMFAFMLTAKGGAAG